MTFSLALIPLVESKYDGPLFFPTLSDFPLSFSEDKFTFNDSRSFVVWAAFCFCQILCCMTMVSGFLSEWMSAEIHYQMTVKYFQERSWGLAWHDSKSCYEIVKKKKKENICMYVLISEPWFHWFERACSSFQSIAETEFRKFFLIFFAFQKIKLLYLLFLPPPCAA